jgi:hypothetical protein
MVFMFLVVTVLSIHAGVVSFKTLYIFSLKKWDKTTSKLKGAAVFLLRPLMNSLNYNAEICSKLVSRWKDDS